MSIPIINLDVKETDNGPYYILDFSYHEDIKEYLKNKTDGAYFQDNYHGKSGEHEEVWVVPATKNNTERIDNLNTSIVPTEEAEPYWDGAEKKLDNTKVSEHKINENIIENIPTNFEPWDHQKKALTLSTKKRNVGLLFEMGTGKTKAAIDIAMRRSRKCDFNNILVLCPLSIIDVWKEELNKHCTIDWEFIDVHCSGNKDKRKESARKISNSDSKLTVGVTTYDTAWRNIDIIRGCNFDGVIADESTEIKNKDAKRTKGAFQISQLNSIKYRLILTGTPVTNSPLDAWAQLHFLKPGIVRKNYWSFEGHYCIKGGYDGKEVIAFKNLDDLTKKIHENCVRAVKSECLDLPSKVFEKRYVNLTGKERSWYNDFKNKSEVVIKEKEGKVDIDHEMTRRRKMHQISSGFFMLPDEQLEKYPYMQTDIFEDDDLPGDRDDDIVRFGQSKLKEVFDIAEKNPDEKIVIWAVYREDIRFLEEKLNDKFEKDAVAVHGGVNNREKLKKKFKNETGTRFIICQLQAFSKGIDLTEANIAIYYTFNFSLEDYQQSQDRIHREGQRGDDDNNVTYIHLIGKDTWDEEIFYSLKNDINVAERITDEVDKIKPGEIPF